MMSDKSTTHQDFVRALQHEPIPCGNAQCRHPVEVTDLSQVRDRVKMFELTCRQCKWYGRLTGKECSAPLWDDATLLVMADEHLMHQQPTCPNDGTPVVFTSLPNPRRKARYRVSCFYCGRQAEIGWPPTESKR